MSGEWQGHGQAPVGQWEQVGLPQSGRPPRRGGSGSVVNNIQLCTAGNRSGVCEGAGAASEQRLQHRLQTPVGSASSLAAVNQSLAFARTKCGVNRSRLCIGLFNWTYTPHPYCLQIWMTALYSGADRAWYWCLQYFLWPTGCGIKEFCRYMRKL